MSDNRKDKDKNSQMPYNSGSTGNDSNNSSNNGGNNNEKKKPITTIVILIISVILTLVFLRAYKAFKEAGQEEVSYSEFLEMVEEGSITNVEIHDEEIYFEPVEENEDSQITSYVTVRTADYKLVDRLKEKDIKFEAILEGNNALINTILSYAIMIGAFYILMLLIMRSAGKSGGMLGLTGKSEDNMNIQKDTGVTFDDVAGQDEAKESLTEMVDFLEHPDKYLEIGAKLPRGALLVGAPGTGKTLLAKAVAGEAKVPFFSISGSEFVELYVGMGASRVRKLFKKATSMAPCIIFIDEIDAIGRSRDSRFSGGDSEREQTLNQLLSEMDGFDTSKGIVILAATNRPEVLDKALLRPGRFDRRVIVSEPDMQGRLDTFKVHAKNVKLDETVDFKELALATAGSVGADIANVINEAALLAVRNGRETVCQKDMLASIEVVFAGKEKKNQILSKEEKMSVAYHEVGHALVTALQKHTLPIQQITIIPRTGGALGYVWQVPEREQNLISKKEMEQRIVSAMGGRAAEQLKFKSITSGASDDIEKATNIARNMVTIYGMSEKLGMVQLETISGEYLDRRHTLNCSPETETKIDGEIRSIMKKSYDRAYGLLEKNFETLDALAKVLVEKEKLTGEEFMKLFEQYQNVKLMKNTDETR